MAEELHEETLRYIEREDLARRKGLGQYFTPRSIRERLIEDLPVGRFSSDELRILDPGCGTGEFLLSCKEHFPGASIEGWDADEKVLSVARKVVPGARLRLQDTLAAPEDEKYDLIIGNPPYFQFRPSENIREEYGAVIGGRTNIYGLFIHKCLRLLKEDGVLAFVNPPSMNNGAYFSRLREYIISQADITSLEVLDPDHFHDANQAVMLLVLRKGPNTGRFVFRKNGLVIFTPRKEHLVKMFKGTRSLRDLGYRVATGKVVWNQHKDKLTSERRVPLIWAHNIVEGGIVLDNNGKKPQYLDVDKYDVGPAIVVNRIVGQAGKGRIRAGLVPEGMRFLGENHVNVIYPPEGAGEEELRSLVKQLNSEEKVCLVQSITGNTQISKTELERLFPVEMPSGKIDKSAGMLDRMGKHERELVEQAEAIIAKRLNGDRLSSSEQEHEFTSLIDAFVKYIRRQYPDLSGASHIGNSYDSVGDVKIVLSGGRELFLELKFLEQGSGTLANISQDSLTRHGIFDCESWSGFRERKGHLETVKSLLDMFPYPGGRFSGSDKSVVYAKADFLKDVVNAGSKKVENVCRELLERGGSDRELLAARIIIDIIEFDKRLRREYLSLLRESDFDKDRLKKFAFLLLTGTHKSSDLLESMEQKGGLLLKRAMDYRVYYLYKESLEIKEEENLDGIFESLAGDIGVRFHEDQTNLVVYSEMHGERKNLLRFVFHWKNKFAGIQTPCLNVFRE